MAATEHPADKFIGRNTAGYFVEFVNEDNSAATCTFQDIWEARGFVVSEGWAS